VKANESVFRSFPELFSRPGPENSFPISIWFSYMLLWFLCDPMFPQLFQRFLSARNRKSIDFTMLLYPIITGYLFLIPVMIGVIGRLSFPDLKGKEADRIIPMLLSIHADNWIGALILTAGLAALMSTLDSQLLTLSSMFTRDIFVYSKEGTKGSWLGRLFVIIIAIIGLLIAYRPPATILVIATQTFTGLAVLFPAFVGGLYWSGATSKGAIISIITGELLVVAYILKLLPTFGFLPVIPVCFMTSMVFVISSILDSYIRNGKLTLPTINGHWIKGKKDFLISLLIMGIIFLLGIDFWAWGSAIPLILGFPWWIWYFFGLNILLIIAMALFLTDSSPFFPSSHKPDGTCQGHN
jgi:SSS family solute:Na+ symporter